ncbi:MAG: ribonuclease HII, partial [Caldilineae bacterium]
MPGMPTLQKEMALHRQGFCFIAGIDEAGRGAWAGPVVAAAVILPLHLPDLPDRLRGVTDSKRLTPRRREALFETIQRVAVSVGVGVTAPRAIDRDRIIAATRRAMQQAVSRLAPAPHYLLIDALPLPDLPFPQHAFPKADA